MKCHLSARIDDDSEHGWEEVTNAAMTNLLRTCLAKSSKDQTTTQTSIKPLTDISKLKKHITIVCDRLSKGGKISI
jgi:Bardet-Biedl syndrome 9 protein